MMNYAQVLEQIEQLKIGKKVTVKVDEIDDQKKISITKKDLYEE